MRSATILIATLTSATMSPAANYTAERALHQGIEVVRLHDAARRTELMVAPSFGNNAFSLLVNGQQVLYSPYASMAEWNEKRGQAGNPFLHPWCNRISEDAFWANGKRYLLNPDLKNFRKDANGKPIHGLVTFANEWKVTRVEASEHEAVTTSRLEFWRRADWLAQFPFAHNVVMTHRLRDGVVEVETVLENLSTEPMPISLGYHAYYQLTDSQRDDWKVRIGAKDHVVLSNVLIPTGETKPIALGDPFPLRGQQLDDVFSGLVRDAAGRAAFSVEGKKQKLTVEYGPNFPISVIYAPRGRGAFICFEPMGGVTNVFNLSHEGKFPVQSVPPSGQWRESFWIKPSGF